MALGWGGRDAEEEGSVQGGFYFFGFLKQCWLPPCWDTRPFRQPIWTSCGMVWCGFVPSVSGGVDYSVYSVICICSALGRLEPMHCGVLICSRLRCHIWVHKNKESGRLGPDPHHSLELRPSGVFIHRSFEAYS